MKIFCRVDDCRYQETGFCKRGNISINEDFECEEYESYLDTEEWQKPFWKRMLDKEHSRICRVKYYGKEIEIEGRKFFVESKNDYAFITDAATGYACGKRAFVEERIDKIIEAANKVEVPLSELPIAVYDEVERVFTYEAEGGKAVLEYQK